MILLNVHEVMILHEKLLAATGGTDGLRDFGLLESAVYSANAGFDHIEQYPTVEEKAVRLAFSLVNNHAFVDGNKRIGILVMLMTLNLNHVAIRYTQKELTDLGFAVANHSAGYEEILTWITLHKEGV